MVSPDALEELQLLFMDHEKSIDTLSDLVRHQQGALLDLAKRLESLEARVRELAQGSPSAESGSPEQPPHY